MSSKSLLTHSLWKDQEAGKQTPLLFLRVIVLNFENFSLYIENNIENNFKTFLKFTLISFTIICFNKLLIRNFFNLDYSIHSFLYFNYSLLYHITIKKSIILKLYELQAHLNTNSNVQYQWYLSFLFSYRLPICEIGT